MSELPRYPAESLSTLSVDALIDLMVREEDRVPRNVIDECARRGEPMLDRIEALLERGAGWEEDATPGEWWLLLHAVMILGLMPDARAGTLLCRFMTAMSEAGDENLEDWAADRWARLFANKPAEVLQHLRAIAGDRRLDGFVRSSVIEPLLALAGNVGKLEEALGWVAALAQDASEQRVLRLMFASHLVDFPRPAYQALLLELARRRPSDEHMLSSEEVTAAYAKGVDRPPWRTRAAPWAFYDPEEIAERQQRWAEEEAGAHDDDDDYLEPYVREGPKVGRNDPCPCGSGKKYKRCCMP